MPKASKQNSPKKHIGQFRILDEAKNWQSTIGEIDNTKQHKIMALIREPLNIDLVINSNSNAQELEKIDFMIQQIKVRNEIAN